MDSSDLDLPMQYSDTASLLTELPLEIKQESRLLNLPLELRQMIYEIVFDTEHVNDFEIYDWDKNNNTTFCLPIKKLQPTRSSQVCKQMREESVPHLFSTNVFRIYAHPHLPDPNPEEELNNTPVIAHMPSACDKWLTKTFPGYKHSFRRLQYRIVDHKGCPVGGSFNLQYEPPQFLNLDRPWYVTGLRIDDGWDVRERIQASGQDLVLHHAWIQFLNLLQKQYHVSTILLGRMTNMLAYHEVSMLREATSLLKGDVQPDPEEYGVLVEMDFVESMEPKSLDEN